MPYNLLEKEDMAVGMVIYYTIECIPSASSKISSKVLDLIYFTILMSYLLVTLPSRVGYKEIKIFLLMHLYSKTLESHPYDGHFFYFVMSLQIRLIGLSISYASKMHF